MHPLAALALAACEDDPPADDTREEVSARLVEGGLVTCADPALRDGAPFDDKEAAAQVLSEANLYGGGLLVEDLDQDGWLDLLLPSELSIQLFYGRAGVLDDLFDDAHDTVVYPSLSRAVGATAADVDGDGDPDVLVTRWERPHTLLRNDGNRVFVDATAEAFGADPPAVRAQSASWADIDGDGDLDLFVGTYGLFADLDVTEPVADCSDHVPDAKLLWRNDGAGHFTDASDLLPPEVQDGYTFMSGFYDLHGDGFPELFVAHDDGLCAPSVMLDNHAGVLSVNTTSGFHPNSHDMGMGVADLDGDELPDFLLTSWNGAYYVESEVGDDGTIRWFDYASIVGLVVDSAPKDNPGLALDGQQVYGWGAEFGDVDNDADLDAIMVFGWWQHFDGAGDPPTQRDGLWIQHPARQFTDEAAVWGVDELGISRGVVLADIDNDGWLDVLKRVLDTTSPLHISRCGDAAWARIRLEAPPPNTAGVGARLRIAADGIVHTRWITSGSTGMYSGSPLEAHVGLGAADTIDRIDVFWPDGATSTFEHVPSRQKLTIVRDH
jgi:hypothetical protein